MPAVLFILGLGLLFLGADWMVRSASRIAASAGISPLVIGLTVVAFGTSAPELAVSTSAAIGGDPDVAIGNVVGSNIFNVLVILATAAIVAPLIVAERLLRRDVLLLVAASLAVWLMALDEQIGRAEGLLLVAGNLAYTGWAIRSGRHEPHLVEEEYARAFGARAHTGRQITLDLVRLLLGLGALVLGSEWFVDGAVEFAESIGVNDLVVGLTLVAAGTSMPELATSIMASARGERDIAVGNVIGSNLFNLLAVLGISAVVAADGVPVAPTTVTVDLLVMILTAALCVPVFFVGFVVTRRDGLLFLSLYVVYVVYLILRASDDPARDPFAVAAIAVGLPLTAWLIGLPALRAWRGHQRPPPIP